MPSRQAPTRSAEAAPGFARRRGSERARRARPTQRRPRGAGLCSAPRIGTFMRADDTDEPNGGAGLCSAPRIGTGSPLGHWTFSVSRRRALLGAEDRNVVIDIDLPDGPSGAGLCSAPRIGTCAPQIGCISSGLAAPGFARRRGSERLHGARKSILSARRRRALLGAEDRNTARAATAADHCSAAPGFARRRGSEPGDLGRS